MKIIKDKDGNIINIGEWKYKDDENSDEIINPLPDGAYEEELNDAEYNKLVDKIKKTEEYKNQLKNIDDKTIRSLRAIIANKYTESDVEYLNNLELEAQKIRTEMNNI